MSLQDNEVKQLVVNLKMQGYSHREIGVQTGVPRYSVQKFLAHKTYNKWWSEYKCSESQVEPERHLPKVLLLDIETSPIKGWIWSLWNNNLSLDMVDSDWFILSYAAKWLGASESEVYYNDMRGRVDTEDDYHLLEELWQLLNDADIIITQNGIKFDAKKINARLILNGFQPPSSYKHIDTYQIASKQFGFTSNKLEWMTDKLNVEFKKLSHNNYPGFKLWKGMMADEIEAWQECELYNKHDVFSLEELYIKLAAWDKKHPNFSLYFNEPVQQCRCGSTAFKEDGYAYTQVSKFQRYRCVKCGAESRSRKNLFTKEKRESIMVNIS